MLQHYKDGVYTVTDPKGRNIRIDMQELVENLTKKHQVTTSNTHIPPKEMTFDRTTEGLKIRLIINNINGRMEKDKPVITHLDFHLLATID